MHLRDQGCTNPTCFSYPVRIARIGLVPARPEELAKLARFVNVDGVAEASQPSSKMHPRAGFHSHPSGATALNEDDLAVDAPHIGGTDCLMQDFAEAIDDAHACCLNPDVQTGPEFSCHRYRPF